MWGAACSILISFLLIFASDAFCRMYNNKRKRDSCDVYLNNNLLCDFLHEACQHFAAFSFFIWLIKKKATTIYERDSVDNSNGVIKQSDVDLRLLCL